MILYADDTRMYFLSIVPQQFRGKCTAVLGEFEGL